MFDSDSEEEPRHSSFVLHNAAEDGETELLRELLAPQLKTEGEGKVDTDFDPEAPPSPDKEDEEDDELELDERDEYGATPLHLALLSAEADCAQLLLEAGAEVEHSLEGQPALHLALAAGALPGKQAQVLSCVRMLLAGGCGVDSVDEMRRTPLHVAAALGLKDCAEVLLEASKSAEGTGDAHAEALAARDRSGAVPLSTAARAGHVALVTLLINAGGLDLSVDAEGRSALHWAGHRGCAETARALRAALGSDAEVHLSKKDSRGRTPALEASRRGHSAAAAILAPGAAPSSAYTPRLPAGITHVIAPPLCADHRTARGLERGAPSPPPENARRLDSLLHASRGLLRALVEEPGAAPHIALDEECDRMAEKGDILRCHEWSYLQRLQRCVNAIPDAPGVIGSLDGDTDVSAGSLRAAFAAAGGVCEAVDRVLGVSAALSGAPAVRNAFVAVRPPGHHAGPFGPVSPSEPPGSGSHGFCLLNNVAIGAAYALSVHRSRVRRVALIDFDVHHGNGTQACVEGTQPGLAKLPFSTAACEGLLKIPTWKPWLGDSDGESVFFASVHGYGNGFYPGTGPTGDSAAPRSMTDAAEWEQDGVVACHVPMRDGPRVLNVGMAGAGARWSRGAAWRRVWAGRVLPQLAQFAPDLILISAGFDAHAKDAIQGPVNLGVTEADYEWLTEQLVAVANSSAGGRIVSVLEGGYRVQGGPASAFARSVAAHVRALALPSAELWDGETEEKAVRAFWAHRAEQQALAQVEAEAAEAAYLAAAMAANAAAEAELGLMAEGDAPAPAEDEAARGAKRAAAAPAGEEEGDGRRAKRARAPVDYAALAARLEEEKRAEAAAKNA